MKVNGFNTVSNSNYSSSTAQTAEDKETTVAAENGTPAATYEKSESKSATVKPDTNMVEKLKADADARHAQLRSLVEKMMYGQADTAGKAGSIYDFLRSGKYTVDAKTKEQAQKDIADDGYWGVEQTSDRLVSFAKAISGGDVSKADKLIGAIKQGFSQAEKSWGGKLPDISKKTLDATLEKMDKWKKELEK